MAPPRIIFLDSYTTNPGDLAWTRLANLGEFVHHKNIVNYPDIISKAKNAEIVILNKAIITKQVLNELPNLKLICVAATGYNSVDLEACSKMNIPVCNVKAYSSPAVAQQVFSLILALRNKVQIYSSEVSQGVWSDQAFFSYQNEPWFELKDKVMGIFGLGQIGENVARIADAFGMKVIAYRKHPEKGSPKHVQLVGKEELFSESDVLSLHTPLNEETKELINARSLGLMKPSALLINTGRGGLVNELDLKNALLSGIIAGAGLDVLSQEPPSKDHILFNLNNCLISPHLAWGSVESRMRLIEGLAKNIEGYLSGKLVNVLN